VIALITYDELHRSKMGIADINLFKF